MAMDVPSSSPVAFDTYQQAYEELCRVMDNEPYPRTDAGLIERVARLRGIEKEMDRLRPPAATFCACENPDWLNRLSASSFDSVLSFMTLYTL